MALEVAKRAQPVRRIQTSCLLVLLQRLQPSMPLAAMAERSRRVVRVLERRAAPPPEAARPQQRARHHPPRRQPWLAEMVVLVAVVDSLAGLAAFQP
jgi:hypothetical protein